MSVSSLSRSNINREKQKKKEKQNREIFVLIVPLLYCKAFNSKI